MNRLDKKDNRQLALVLSGGGARGAYEVGIIHYIRTMLPASVRHRRFPIQCGSSVGAINTCFMASTANDLEHQGKRIVSLWRELKTENIYSRNLSALSHFLAKSTLGILGNLFRHDFFKEKHGVKPHFFALFDTKPFLPHLNKIIDWKQLHQNVREKLVDSISLVATRMRTGSPEIFIQKGGKSSSKGDYPIHEVDLGPEHAMGSAAIPLVFPSVVIGDNRYVDGSVRLNTPLSPAIHLGARKILTISLNARHGNKTEHACPETRCPPSLGEHLGKLFNAFFLDRLNYDMDQLERINRMIEASEKIYGKDYLDRINSVLGDRHPIDKIDLLEIGPSQPLSSVFAEWYRRGSSKVHSMTLLEKFLMKALDIEPALSLDLMSYLTFEKGYLEQLIEIGFQDAKKYHGQLLNFLEEPS
ncbi:MAG: patatin-like phospholipase family protein [Deltaproteobacteria bacterium]|nr:patatin-like phospholipase family protein [Deltaproteobacteria bacterium]